MSFIKKIEYGRKDKFGCFAVKFFKCETIRFEDCCKETDKRVTSVISNAKRNNVKVNIASNEKGVQFLEKDLLIDKFVTQYCNACPKIEECNRICENYKKEEMPLYYIIYIAELGILDENGEEIQENHIMSLDFDKLYDEYHAVTQNQYVKFFKCPKLLTQEQVDSINEVGNTSSYSDVDIDSEIISDMEEIK